MIPFFTFKKIFLRRSSNILLFGFVRECETVYRNFCTRHIENIILVEDIRYVSGSRFYERCCNKLRSKLKILTGGALMYVVLAVCFKCYVWGETLSSLVTVEWEGGEVLCVMQTLILGLMILT